MNHIVVIPYYCEDEIRRYLLIADLLTKFGGATGETMGIEFLLAPAPSIDPNDRLFDAFSKISTVKVYRCTTNAVGYPQRPTAMFWEIMEHIASAYLQDGGFVLWLESDMIPIREDWVSKLTAEWTSSPGLILMGPLIPEFRTRKGDVIPEHINGGSCYAKDIARHVPLDGRRSYFDLALFSYVKATKRFKASDLFVLSTCHDIPKLISSPEVVILHGYLQPKDKFVRTCIDMVNHSPDLKPMKSWLSKLLCLRIPRRCCKHRYRNGRTFFCPIHGQKRPPELSVKTHLFDDSSVR